MNNPLQIGLLQSLSSPPSSPFSDETFELPRKPLQLEVGATGFEPAT